MQNVTHALLTHLTLDETVHTVNISPSCILKLYKNIFKCIHIHRHTPNTFWQCLFTEFNLVSALLSLLSSLQKQSFLSVLLLQKYTMLVRTKCPASAFNIHPTKPLAQNCSPQSFKVLFYPFSWEQQKDKKIVVASYT